MRLYLDANAIIYSIKGAAPLRQKVADRVTQSEDVGGSIMTSRLSRLECRVKPIRLGNRSLLDLYDKFFDEPQLVLGEINALIIERATELRARHRLSTPDAIHMSTAMELHADLLLTGDARMAQVPGIDVELI